MISGKLGINLRKMPHLKWEFSSLDQQKFFQEFSDKISITTMLFPIIFLKMIFLEHYWLWCVSPTLINEVSLHYLKEKTQTLYNNTMFIFVSKPKSLPLENEFKQLSAVKFLLKA